MALVKFKSDMTDKDIIDNIDQTYYQKGKRYPRWLAPFLLFLNICKPPVVQLRHCHSLYLLSYCFLFYSRVIKVASNSNAYSVLRVWSRLYPDKADVNVNTNRGLLGMFQKSIIPCDLSFRMLAMKASPPGCLSPTLEPVRPAVSDTNKIIREVQPFLDMKDIKSPALDFVNTLYFYPESLNFNRHPSTSSRNIALKVKVMEGGEDSKADGLPLIYGRTRGKQFHDCVWSTVTYHSTRPSFFGEEVKIKLPVALKKTFHIVVEFYHIKCNAAGKKKGKDKVDDLIHPLGFAVIPLVDKYGELLPDQTDAVPVFLNEGKDYLTPDAAAAIPMVDQGKKLFNFRTYVVSTVHCQETRISKFFKSISLGTEGGGAHLRKSMVGLSKAPHHLLLKFMPVIFTHLLRVVREEKEEYACQAVSAYFFSSICKFLFDCLIMLLLLSLIAASDLTSQNIFLIFDLFTSTGCLACQDLRRVVYGERPCRGRQLSSHPRLCLPPRQSR